MSSSNSYILSSKTTQAKTNTDLQKITHDLNNILNNILNGLDSIKDNIDSNNVANELLKKVKSQAQLASEIICEISDSSSIKKTKNVVSLNKIVEDSIYLFNVEENKNQKIIYTNNCEEDFILANYTEIKRAILNILINAKEAKIDTYISIELNQISNNNIELSIKDNGPGINIDNLLKIFSEGFSTKSVDHPINKGLGLSIVKEIIEEHNGNISVDSNPGNGTLFKIIFPLFKKEKPKKTFNNKTIIIAEDDQFQREVLKDLLCSLNIKTLAAANGEEVLKFLNSHYPDLIIIDKSMPIMDGLECIEIIKEKSLNIPIVLTSGSDIELYKMNRNITEILRKPYNFEMIQNILERLL
ncbi:MAG: response regulator [Ignavibacteriae bacterium]|nr:response regulator [Ignavibacteriota bacterium]